MSSWLQWWTVRFPFMLVEYDQGLRVDRPVVPLRLQRARRFTSALCLLDSGDLNNYMDWSLAEDAGIDLEAAVQIRGGDGSERRLTKVQCFIEDGHGCALALPDVQMIFVRPWRIPGFRCRLGTLGMERFLVRLSTGEQWTEITELCDDSQPAMRFNFHEDRDPNGSPLARPMIPVHMANEPPWPAVLDTGSPDSFIARNLADEAGLADAQPTDPFSLGGKPVAGLKEVCHDDLI